MATTGDRIYPFTGIVGMADLKLALLLNAVSPAIGGVLVRGEKGTAKSTMVRGLAALLPPVPVVPGCPYSCDPAAPDPACPAGPHSAVAPELRPVTLAELRAWTRQSIADYKSPDILELIDTLPLTSMGKVDKRALSAVARELPAPVR